MTETSALMSANARKQPSERAPMRNSDTVDHYFADTPKCGMSAPPAKNFIRT